VEWCVGERSRCCVTFDANFFLFASTAAEEDDEGKGDAALPPCTPPASWFVVSAPSDPAPFVSLALLASLSSRSPPSLKMGVDMVREEEGEE